MSLYNRDEAFIQALKKHSNQRTEKDLDIIFSRLHRYEALSNTREHSLRALCNRVHYEWHDANEILYGKDDFCNCWYILLSGSIFIQGSMFLRNTSFGKQIPGSKRRGCQCLVLEPSEMIAIDYPDMHPPLHSGVGSVRVPAGRNLSTSSRSTLDSVAEVDSSSGDSSPSHNSSRTSSLKMANGQATTVKIDNNNSEVIKHSSEYYNNQDDSTSFGYPDQEEEEDEEDQEDSISLRSSSSLVKDLVTDVLKKEILERNEDDHDVLLEFTKSLQAFSNMTEPIRRELCKVMVFACVEKADTTLLKQDELLDSWSVIINGQVQVVLQNGDKINLYIGDSFGVTPDVEPQFHKGTMYTMMDDCQFLCIAQQDYCQVLHQGQENMEYIKGEDGKLAMVKEKREIEGGKKGLIVIRGTPDSLLNQLLEENSIDTTYAEDYLLTYRAFCNEPVKFCGQLLEWFDKEEFKAKVTRVILLWVNNHFNDFECSRYMIELLEKFEEKLQKCNKTGECRLFNIACSTKAKSRVITLSRSSNEEDLTFSITGGTEGHPIYILRVEPGSDAEEKGLKRGDQLFNVNGQNFEKLNMEKANTILRKNTDLTLVVKTNLFAFKEMMSDLKNPHKKKEKAKKGKGQDGAIIAQISTMQPSRMSRAGSVTADGDAFDGKPKKGGTLGRRAMNKMNKVRTKMFHKKDQSFREFFEEHGGTISENEAVARDDSFLSSLKQGSVKWLPGSSATVDGPRSFRQAAAFSSSNPDLLDQTSYAGQENTLTEVPEDVIKVFRADQSYRFVFVNQDTTAEEAVRAACKEFGIVDNIENYSLCRVSVQNENFVKQSKLPDKWANLAEIPLSARYYLKNNLDSEQLLPDENIPELLKEANYTFLDLSCFEVALHLTLQDYELFKTVEQTNFIDDLFKLNESNLSKFKEFEDLVNRELFWVVSTICSEPSVIRRAKIFKHFTKIAHHCKVLKNLNSTFAIISGLGYRAVSRMKMTWEKVPAKCQRTFDDLQALMDPSRNMSKYRTLLNDMMTQPPVIPYIPVVKKDLTFLHLGNDTIVDNLVNFEKMRMIGREVRNICRLCSADSSQIISSALAHQHEADRPTSNIYHTLTRRGRRSSFNNARKMYEDAVNARRVKQYMQQLKIESDEDKLMELSKQVELPGVPNSAQTKRRNTTASFSNNDSPSRSSKTLPAGPQTKNSYLRNNSEPQIPMIPGLAAQPTRKKNPISSLPKFGTTSPQAIKKLLSLSEDGDGGSSGSSKHSSLEQKRSGSTSSRELSPANSPHATPRKDLGKPKIGNHENLPSSIAHENTNRNNNQGHDNSPALLRHHPHAKHLHVSKQSGSTACSSSRSSIASSSSLGLSSSSLNVPPFSSSSSTNSSSPRSSPTHWSGPVGAQFSDALYPFQHGGHRNHNGPVRSSSSSSADTVKSAGRPCSDRPVIMQNRSGSFGALSITTVSDRRLAHGAGERRLIGSSSSPSLSARAAASSHHLILPNHPQIPRTPSIDSGVVSIGSNSADSTRFLNSDANDIFPHTAAASHQSSSSLALSEGYESQLSLVHQPGNHQSPVMRRHLQNLQHKSMHEKLSRGIVGKEASTESKTTQTTTFQDKKPARPSSGPGSDEKPKDKDDDVKETFLFGSRGWGDAPLMRDKDPWPIGTDLPPAMPLMPSHSGWSSSVAGDDTVAIGDTQTNAVLRINSANQNQTQNLNTKVKEAESDDRVDGNVSQQKPSSEQQQYYDRLRLQERPNPPSSLSFQKAVRNTDTKTPEAILEEKLLLELEQQRPRLHKSFDQGILHVQEKNGFNLPSPMSERHSASFAGTSGQYHDEISQSSTPRLQKPNFSKSDPSFRPPDPGVSVEYPGYSYLGGYCNKPGCKCPASRNPNAPPRRYMDYNNALGFPLQSLNYPPARTSSPKHLERQYPGPGFSEADNVFVSDFGGPMPKTTYILNDKRHSMEDIRTKSDVPPYPYRCPKHGSPIIHPPQSNIYSQMPNQIYHQHPTRIPNSPVHPRNSTPETPGTLYMHGQQQRIVNYGPQGLVPLNLGDKRSSFVHSRSSSDISGNSDHYSYSDSHSYTHFSPVPVSSKHTFPSPISRQPQYCDLPPEKLSVSTEKLSNLSITTTPKSHRAPARRKSSEWGVTDLDTDNQQQAMQVWASGSTTKKAAMFSDDKDVSCVTSQSDSGNSPSKTLSKDKKPPPLPPQRNSSYQVTRQLRLSSGTLSPLSSPPTSPTTPVSLKKLLLSEEHPQLVVKTKVEEDNIETLSEKKMPMSNGVVPQMKPSTATQSRDTLAAKERTLPTYTQAVSHLNSQNKSILTSSQLPTYRNIQ